MPSNIETRVGFFVLCALGVFVYMGFQIGAFRFDRSNYNKYTLNFKDISGLSRKADVKIAGVSVGWVEKVALMPNDESMATALVMIKKDYILYRDAYGIVRQDGLLGPKYVEIMPGNPMRGQLPKDSVLSSPNVEQTSVDELMRHFKHIAVNVEQLTDSLKNVFGGPDGQLQVQQFVSNVSNTFAQFSTVGDVIVRALARNEDNVDKLLAIGTNFQQVTDQLKQEVFPTFQKSIEKISDVFDRDFNRVATHLTSTAESLEAASSQAQQGMQALTSVAEKIDEGKGLLGKLINEEEIYNDLRFAVRGFKSYLSKIERMQIVFDSHFESMYRVAENYEFEDSKGYFDVRIHPNEDHFYLIEFASSQKGFIKRTDRLNRYVDEHLHPIDLDKLDVSGHGMVDNVLRRQKLKINRNSLKIGLQFGKIFGDLALRFGLFEGTAGVGVDIDVPFHSERFRWVTTFELFDMSGWNRIDDRRPHAKWLNRMYFLRNLYFDFGADDFISKHNASAFAGAGLRFGDDDVKYLLSSISGVSSSAIS